VDCKAIVMNPELAPNFASAKAQVKLPLGAFVLGGAVDGLVQIDKAVDQAAPGADGEVGSRGHEGRRGCALHLHVGHDGSAEGCEDHGRAGAGTDARVQGRDGGGAQ
jgi:hypothetical protein